MKLIKNTYNDIFLSPPHISRWSIVARSLVVFTVLFSSPAVLATEGGAGYYVPGSMATLIDLAPNKPGWIVEPMYLHYEGDTSVSKKIPVAGVVAANMSATSDALLVGALYSFEQPVFGATYTIGAYLPYVWMDIDADIATQVGTLRVHDSESGLGDVTLYPVMLAWQSGYWLYTAVLPIYAPTGDFDEGKLANTGLNYWSLDPTLGLSYNNDQTGLNVALFGGVTFNTENSDTDYRSGSMFHLDGSIEQLLPLGPGFLSIGVEAFYLNQISDDDSDSQLLGDFRGRSTGVGPVLGYILPRGEETLVFEMKWLTETDVENRLKGDYVWLKLVYQY